jgi:hypothetical protein
MVEYRYYFSFCVKIFSFLDSMDIRHKVQDSIESHGGKVMEKMPNAVGIKSF